MKYSTTTCSRRDILKLAASSVLITMLPAITTGCSAEKGSIESISRRMVELLNYPVKAREIGEIYINQTTEVNQQSFEQLTKRLLTNLSFDPENIENIDWDSLDESIHKQVRQDFVDENVVIVKGWMLSRTEIALCTIAAMRSVHQE